MSPQGRGGDSAGPATPAVDADLGFRPIVDLDAGTVLAIEVDIWPPATDTGNETPQRWARLARQAVAEEPLLPLVLPLPVAAVTSRPETFDLVENELRRAGRRPRDITLTLGPELREVPRSALVHGVHRLRERGFRCAFGTSSVPPDLLVEAAPFLLRIDPDIIAGIPADDRRVGLVEGLVLIGRGSGVYPMAAGVTTLDQVVKLRDTGVRLAHGPFFTGDHWRPGERVNPVPDPSVTSDAAMSESGPRVSEFTGPPVAVTANATAEEVREVFTNDPALNSVVLVDHRDRPTGLIDRSRFLLAITGPYGHALHARRPAERLADSPRTVGRGVPAMSALRAAGTDRERVYDDLITVNEFGQCTGIVHVGDLIRSLAGA